MQATRLDPSLAIPGLSSIVPVVPESPEEEANEEYFDPPRPSFDALEQRLWNRGAAKAHSDASIPGALADLERRLAVVEGRHPRLEKGLAEVAGCCELLYGTFREEAQRLEDARPQPSEVEARVHELREMLKEQSDQLRRDVLPQLSKLVHDLRQVAPTVRAHDGRLRDVEREVHALGGPAPTDHMVEIPDVDFDMPQVADRHGFCAQLGLLRDGLETTQDILQGAIKESCHVREAAESQREALAVEVTERLENLETAVRTSMTPAVCLGQRARVESGGGSRDFIDIAGQGDVVDVMRARKLVRKVPLFRHLSEPQREDLVRAFTRERYSRWEVVVEQGEPGSSFFVIGRGEVSVIIDQKRMCSLGRNAYFGERALLASETRGATVQVSSEEAELWSIDEPTFSRVVRGKMLDEMRRRIRLQDTQARLRDFDRTQVIGVGSFGAVRLAVDRKTQMRYALKRVLKVDGQVPLEVRRECEIIAQNDDHPFLLKVVKTFETARSVHILTELITGGNLRGALHDLSDELPRTHARFYIGSLLIVLDALWDRRILYRDLKPENVMLDSQGYVKLIDFGIARRLAEGDAKAMTVVGTPHYMAPEVARGFGSGPEQDLWSLGVLLFEMVCGELPFAESLDAPSPEDVVRFSSLPVRIPETYKDREGRQLIEGLLTADPAKRLGASGHDEVMRAQFFADASAPGDLPETCFQRILGRQFDAPWVPNGEVYGQAGAVLAAPADSEGSDEFLDDASSSSPLSRAQSSHPAQALSFVEPGQLAQRLEGLRAEVQGCGVAYSALELRVKALEGHAG